MKPVLKHVALISTLAALAGCGGDEAGRGTLAVEVWGEEYIEEGIPAEEFVDGWSVTFDRFLVVIGDVTVARGDGGPDIDDPTQRVFDLTRPGPYPFLTQEVPAGRYDNTGYTIAPAGAGAIAGNATAADLELMQSEGYAVYAEGTAEQRRHSVAMTFAWGFERTTSYVECHSGADLNDGESGTVQLTIHADHLFYDDLFSEEPDVTFEVLAEADDDGNSELTPEELAAYDLTALPNYGTGSTGIENLWDFIDHLTGTLGHIDGEGHCHADGDGH